MVIGRHIVEAMKPAIDLIYPPRCPLCGAGMADQNGICAECWSQLIIPGEPCCKSCQRPFRAGTATNEMSQCAPCMENPPTHDGISAATLYNDASRKLILAFKHGKRIALAKMLAKLMAVRLPDLQDEWLVVPVPLHRARLWSRGFNQSALLAQIIAGSIGQPLLVDGMVRIKRTIPLGGLGKKARAQMLKGAIAVAPRKRPSIEGANVILVDDVLTSGATTDACVRALKSAGANKVRICCFARVLDDI